MAGNPARVPAARSKRGAGTAARGRSRLDCGGMVRAGRSAVESNGWSRRARSRDPATLGWVARR